MLYLLYVVYFEIFDDRGVCLHAFVVLDAFVVFVVLVVFVVFVACVGS